MSARKAFLFSDFSRPLLVDRLLRACQFCCSIGSGFLLLLPAETPEDLNRRSALQTLGLETYQCGTNMNIGPSRVLVVAARRWRLERVRNLVKAIPQAIPDLPVCVLTGTSKSGISTQGPASRLFYGARSSLDPSGLSLLSLVGASSDHSV